MQIISCFISQLLLNSGPVFFFFFFFFWVHRGVLCGAVQSDQLFFCWKGQFHWHRNSGVHDRHYVLGGSRIAAFFMELRDL